MSRAREGDREAMEELVSRHHASVYRVALGILGDTDAAADAAQETFLKALRALKGFRGEASFRTWLLTIASNEARGRLRKAWRRKELPLDDAPPVADGNESAETRLERTEEAERIEEKLKELPEKQRLAVTLRVFEGLSFREIGVLIGSSEGAARVNYHHGIHRLKKSFQ